MGCAPTLLTSHSASILIYPRNSRSARRRISARGSLIFWILVGRFHDKKSRLASLPAEICVVTRNGVNGVRFNMTPNSKSTYCPADYFPGVKITAPWANFLCFRAFSASSWSNKFPSPANLVLQIFLQQTMSF